MNTPSVAAALKLIIEVVLPNSTVEFFNKSSIDKDFSFYKTLKGKFLHVLKL